jgi:sporulation protein YlmC with PRC-barrel domain
MTVDVEGVDRHLMESDVVGASEVDDDVIDTAAIESRMTEGEVVESEFIKRTLIEEEVADEYRERYVLEDSDRLASESVESTQIESAIVDEETVPAGGVGEARADEPTETTETTATAETSETPGATPEATDDEYAEGEAVGSEVDLSNDDIGKTVVDEHGTDVGIVSDVDADRVHVNPDAGITERIKSSLGWGDTEDTYAIGTEQIDRIDDDRVVLRSI